MDTATVSTSVPQTVTGSDTRSNTAGGSTPATGTLDLTHPEPTEVIDLTDWPGDHSPGEVKLGEKDYHPNRAGANHGVATDAHVRADDRAAAQPHVVGERDRSPILPAQAAGLGIDRMSRLLVRHAGTFPNRRVPHPDV